MKSINQIFKNNKELMNELEVSELIDYCLELEDQLILEKQKTDQTVVLKQLISEIKTDCSLLLSEDEKGLRWPNEFNRVDFKEAVLKLKEYIFTYCLDNRITL